MPYYDAGTLEDRIASEGALPVPVAVAWFAQLAGALAAAHRLGIVHRDVRPANILLDRASGGVVLTDFGLAAVLESGSVADLRITLPGQVLGLAAWASPEQLGGEEVTERTDVYSLGVVAFQLFTGRLPFGASTAADHLRATRDAEPPRVRDLRPDAPPGVDALISRCLKKKPEQRPFAAEVVELLHSLRSAP
jgi:serine/threonine-protein kinase